MRYGHAASGWCAGAAVSRLIGITTVPGVVVVATVTAGWTLWPDIDCNGATATKVLGWWTALMSRILCVASAFAFKHTKTDRDKKSTGTHRHLTHTLWFAIWMGAAAGFGTWLGGVPAVLALIGFGFLLASAALGDWIMIPAIGCAAYLATAHGAAATLHQAEGWIGIAVFVGCVAHCIGDSITESGVPFWWGLITIDGQRWHRVFLVPRIMRIKTSKRPERLLLWPAFTLGAVALIPGVVADVAMLIGHAHAYYSSR